MTKVRDIFMTALDKVKGWYEIARDWVLNYYAQIKPLWPYEDILQFKYVVLIALALILILLIVIIASINRAKKRKVKYYVDGKVYAKQKVKFRKPLNFPAVEKEGMVLVGWFKNKKQDSDVVEVGKVSRKEYMILGGVTIAMTFAFYFLLKWLDTAELVVSTISLVTSALATYLVFRR